MSPACPVSAKLTEDEKATLLGIKKYAIERTKAPQTPVTPNPPPPP
jgi:hypothetical protein